MNNIAVVAACDRNNYGDVLLPVLFKEMLAQYRQENDYKIDVFGLTYSDMTYMGGNKTRPLYMVDEHYDSVVFVGGEILAARYVNMFLNLQEDERVIAQYSSMASCDYEKCDEECRKVLHGVNDYPWVFYPKNTNQKVFYNAVGGAHRAFSTKQKKAWERCISETTMFTVRNNRSQIYFREICGIDIDLVPDSAILIKEFITEKKYIREEIEQIVKDLGNYITLQVNKRYGEDREDEIASIINEVYRQFKIKTILLPIGKAQGHEDAIPLNIIHNSAPIASVYIYDNSIYETMYLIRNSMLFVGTSLHGIITAASYSVPHTVLFGEADKTIGFINTWNTTKCQYLEKTEDLIAYIKSKDIYDFINIDSITSMKYKAKKMFDKEFANIFC